MTTPTQTATPAPAAAAQQAGGRYFYGTGRRKSAIARVRITPGATQFIVNGKTSEEYFGGRAFHQIVLNDPFRAVNLLGRFGVSVKVVGGGTTGQVGAVRHGIARALIVFDATLRPTLKRAGYLTRDPRVKERKHVGLKKARRAPQYTKR